MTHSRHVHQAICIRQMQYVLCGARRAKVKLAMGLWKTFVADAVAKVAATASAVLSARSAGARAVALCGVKANIGHTENGAGAPQLLRLLVSSRAEMVTTNTQLRRLNPHLNLRTMNCVLPAQSSELKGRDITTSGVSSFGYAGTIAHAVIRRAEVMDLHVLTLQPMMCKRRVFNWLTETHPFCQLALSSSTLTELRSPIYGALYALVADHIVQETVIFPGAGYLEMARAASSRVSRRAAAALHGVVFLRPLAIDDENEWRTR